MNMDWQPPAGYRPVASHLSGVTVYAPAPVVETGPEARTFKCPQCGGTTAFDPTAASVVCPYCGTSQALAADVVGRAAEEREFTLAALDQASRERGWGQERRELHCESCGADLSLAVDDLSTICPFCGSNRVVARVADPDTLRPRFLVPFTVAERDCPRLAREWLGRGWMHPGGLANAARAARFRGVYLPFWTFDATIQAQWRAEVGHERTTRHYDHHSKTWRTRRHIDWRWEEGHVTLAIDDWLGAGTTRVSLTLLPRLQPFDLQALVAYEPGFLAGWSAQAYDVPLPAAWDTARTAMREQARQACRGDIHSAHVRNFGMAADFADETWRYILLPVFIAAYRFQGQPYQVLINGQTGQVVGQKPVTWWKVGAVVAGLLAPGVLMGLLGLPLLAVGGLGLVPLVLGAVLFIIGLVIAGLVLRSAMEAGQA
ncbi:MAG: TFIIB-type zinc ribbon-containing protein [Chloroflexi bacterium]|nr:TFIIB-type zinc ribbon-containing protein [Chloroflexota bacterium]MBU1751865.1 TFIIB-type zinc ribbon-containing protein [Chloroflexota bacterium]